MYVHVYVRTRICTYIHTCTNNMGITSRMRTIMVCANRNSCPARAREPRLNQGGGGPDKLSSLRNNHMTSLHSSLHKYIHAVHDLHCIPRYISTYT